MMLSTEVRFDIVLNSLNAHIYRVRCILKNLSDAQITFSLPSWTPGSYLIREFAQHVLEVKAFSQKTPVPVSKVNKDSWSCMAHGSDVLIEYDVYAFDSSIRAAFLDDTYGFFTGTSLLMRFHGLEKSKHTLTIQKPEFEAYKGFRIATSMMPHEIDELGFGTYTSKDYDEAVDHPFLISDHFLATFDVDGIPHHLAITPRVHFDTERLVNDCKHICKQHIDLFGGPAPFSNYFFLLRVETDSGYGGLEHRASSALLCKMNDLPLIHQKKVSDGYRSLLGLISHEYFHAWNVKRLKPSEFVSYDYNSENYTKLLWFFEGFTSYYDDLALCRSQSITSESYFELLSRAITRVYSANGRTKQSLADSSYDAWIKFYRPNENSPNATVSYYLKGSLVALALDLSIRSKTNDERSLDDVLKALWKKSGIRELGITQEMIVQEASNVAQIDLSSFFDTFVHATTDLPLSELFDSVGIDVKWQEQLHLYNRSMPLGYVGCQLKRDSAACQIVHVDADSPAMLAGLSAGDEILALNDLRVSADSYESHVSRYLPGDVVKVHVFRRGWLREFSIVLGEHPKTTCVLKKKDKATPAQLAALKSWLHN